MAALPTEGLSVAAQAKFALLHQRFVQGLPARWQEIAAANTLPARQDALHRLAGGAGSYGFERVGQLARQAEQEATTGNLTDLANTLVLLKNALDLAQTGSHPTP